MYHCDGLLAPSCFQDGPIWFQDGIKMALNRSTIAQNGSDGPNIFQDDLTPFRSIVRQSRNGFTRTLAGWPMHPSCRYKSGHFGRPRCRPRCWAGRPLDIYGESIWYFIYSYWTCADMYHGGCFGTPHGFTLRSPFCRGSNRRPFSRLNGSVSADSSS